MSSSSSTQLRNWRRVWRLTTAILIALLFLVPIVYVVMISLESPNQFLDHPLVPPVPPSVQNFSSAYQQGDLGAEVVNTIIYSVSAAAISTGLSLLIAFPIARKLIRLVVVGVCLVRDRDLPAPPDYPAVYRGARPPFVRQSDRVHSVACRTGPAPRCYPVDGLHPGDP